MNQAVHFVNKRALLVETDLCVSTEKRKKLSDDVEPKGVEIV
jgi:hypothetical protein